MCLYVRAADQRRQRARVLSCAGDARRDEREQATKQECSIAKRAIALAQLALASALCVCVRA
jgi:hypothetical protein